MGAMTTQGVNDFVEYAKTPIIFSRTEVNYGTGKNIRPQGGKMHKETIS
jgi:hypothetical protein